MSALIGPALDIVTLARLEITDLQIELRYNLFCVPDRRVDLGEAAALFAKHVTTDVQSAYIRPRSGLARRQFTR